SRHMRRRSGRGRRARRRGGAWWANLSAGGVELNSPLRRHASWYPSPMSPRVLTCPRCGALLPPRAARVAVVGGHGGASVTHGTRMVRAADYRRALADLSKSDDSGLPRVTIGGLPYRVFGRVARGESSDVFLAERAHPVTERVLVKVLRAASDADLMDREW